MQQGSPIKPKKNPSSWSAKEEFILIELRNVKGNLWTSIGVTLGKYPEDCRAHYTEIMHERLLGRKRPTPTKVKCLGTITPLHYFVSEDKSRFRICPACKALTAGLPDTAIDIIENDLLSEEDLDIKEEDEFDTRNNSSDVPDYHFPSRLINFRAKNTTPHVIKPVRHGELTRPGKKKG